MTKVNETFALQITDSTFEKEVINGSGPVLVDFWAEWCRPCHTIAPILEELAEEYPGRLRVAKVNVDENPGSVSGQRSGCLRHWQHVSWLSWDCLHVVTMGAFGPPFVLE